MSIKDKVEQVDKRLKSVEGKDVLDKSKKPFKLPFKFRGKRNYKKGKVLVIHLGYNHYLNFKWGVLQGGLIKVGTGDEEEYYDYESGAVYFYKKFPVVVVFQWRLNPAGGMAEEYKNKNIGGDDDKGYADDKGLSSHAQQTIIRAIKQAEIDKDDDKKKSKKGLIWIIIAGVVGVYLIANSMGWA